MIPFPITCVLLTLAKRNLNDFLVLCVCLINNQRGPCEHTHTRSTQIFRLHRNSINLCKLAMPAIATMQASKLQAPSGMEWHRPKQIHLATRTHQLILHSSKTKMFICSNNECSSADRALWVRRLPRLCRITFTVSEIIISRLFQFTHSFIATRECNKWTVHFPQRKYYYYRIKSEVDEATEARFEVFCSISVRVQMPLTFCNDVIARMP